MGVESKITEVFVNVCWASPGYGPYIDPHTLTQIVLRSGMLALFMAAHFHT